MALPEASVTTIRVPLGARVSKLAGLDAVLLAGAETSAGAAAAGLVVDALLSAALELARQPELTYLRRAAV